MLAAEARRQRALLERIIERRLRLEEVPHRQEERLHEFCEENRTGCLIAYQPRTTVETLATNSGFAGAQLVSILGAQCRRLYFPALGMVAIKRLWPRLFSASERAI